MNVTALAAAALATALLAQLLKKTNPELATGLTVGAGVLFAIFVISALSPVWIEMEELLSASGADGELIGILMKCLGTCLVAQFAADCCRDAGETALAGRVEFAGKAAVVTLSLPLFKEILALSLELLG